MSCLSGAMADPAPVTAFAAAKINLYLHVVGRRTDGFHLLDMLITFADVGDRISVQPADNLSLTVAGPFAPGIPTGEDNLVLKAARSLAGLAGIEPRAAIHLEKILPPASGIGGGSADAAATLKALRDLWDLDIPKGELQTLAISLGADVPMCLAGRAAFSSGIGEVLQPAPPLPPAWFVLVNPGVPVSTPAVFRARSGPFGDPGSFTDTPSDAPALARLLEEKRNDLEGPARAITPAVDDALAALAATENVLLVRMSGSGATCFGLFATESDAQAAAGQITIARPGWWVAAARLLEQT